MLTRFWAFAALLTLVVPAAGQNLSGSLRRKSGPFVEHPLNRQPHVRRAMAVDLVTPVDGRPVRLTMEEFDGGSVTALLRRYERSADGALIRGGSLEGDPFSEVMLVQYGRAISGHVQRGDGRYSELITLEGAAGPQLYLRELERAESLLQDVEPAAALQQAPPATGDGSDDGSVIDLMVVYSDQARAARGGKDQIEALIREAVAMTNGAYERSGVQTRLRLVHSREVRYSEASTYRLDLSNLTNIGDGLLDEIHALRNHYGADLVSLWVNNAVFGVAGTAWLGRNRPEDEGLGFSVVSTPNALPVAFAHEVGHNLGADHDRANAGGTPAFPYAYGYQGTTGGRAFRTIMAYECAGVRCPPIPYFSTPLVTYEGLKVGDGVTDNARAFNETRKVAARYRAAVSNPAQNFRIDPARLTIPAAGGAFPVEVTADGAWRVVSGATWLTISGGSGEGNGRFVVTAAANSGPVARSTLVFAGTETMTVVQNGNSGAACTVAPLVLDTEIETALTLCGGTSVAQYSFQGTANQQISLEVKSRDFDPAIAIYAPNNTTRFLAYGDDYKNSTDARIPESGGFLTLPVSGLYHLSVFEAAVRSRAGRFTLAVRNSGEYCRYSVPSALRFGPGAAPAQINIGTAPGCGWNLETQTPWIRLTMPAQKVGPQTVLLEVEPSQDGATRRGEVQLSAGLLTQPLKIAIVQEADDASCADGAAVLDQPVAAVLNTACGSLQRGRAYATRRYRFQAPAGQRMMLEARSAEFDPYLILYSASGSVIAASDDTGASRGARIGSETEPLRLAEGEYIAEVSAFEPGSRGNFTLTLSTNVQAPAFESALVSPGAVAKVELPESVDATVFSTRLLEVESPANATALDVNAVVTPASEGLSLYARYGEPPVLADGAVTADFSAQASDGRITLAIAPVKSGKLYLAFGRDSAGGAVTVEVSVRPALAPTSAIRLLDQVMSAAQPAAACALPTSRTDVFRAADRQAMFAFTAITGAAGSARVDFISPEGVRELSVNLPAGAEGNFCGQAALALTGAANGTWKARLFWNDREVFARSFAVSTSAPPLPPLLAAGQAQTVTVDGAAIFRFQAPADASRVTFRLQNQSGADADLYVRAGVPPSSVGSRVAADFVSEAPSGDETIAIDTASLPPLQTDVPYYVAAIAKNGGSGRVALTASVVVEPVLVTRAVVGFDERCSANVQEYTTFNVATPNPVRLHLIGRVRTEASVEFEFVTPTGQRIPRAAPVKLTPGVLCAGGGLEARQVSEAANSGVGEWQARAYINGALALTRPFTVTGRPPAAVALQSGSGAGYRFVEVASGLLPTQFVITVPANSAKLDIVVSKKSASQFRVNLDLLVRRGGRVVNPSQVDYTQATEDASGELLTIADPPAGDYYIAVQSPALASVDVSVQATVTPK